MITISFILFWFCLFIVFYTFIGYGILLWLLVKIKESIKSPPIYQICQYQSVTLFIAAYNEESIVDSKMSNCLELDYPKEKLNIVWITDGSDDTTNDKLAQYRNVEILYQPLRQGKTAALNRGIKYVKDSIVIFNDANAMLNKDAIKEIVKHFANPKVGCVSGEKRITIQTSDTASTSGEGFYWKYESFLKDLDSRLYSTVGAAGELFAVRTELFEELPEDTLLDDFMQSMLITQKGYVNVYEPNAYASEDGSLDMHEEEKRKIRIAAGGLQSVWRLRPLLNIFRYRILSFQYISHRVLRWTITPIVFFLLLPINIFICLNNNSLIYSILLILQVIFYMLGTFGYILAKKKIKIKILFIPYYMLFMNLNVFKGFRYLKKKRKKGVWDKSKRKESIITN